MKRVEHAKRNQHGGVGFPFGQGRVATRRVLKWGRKKWSSLIYIFNCPIENICKKREEWKKPTSEFVLNNRSIRDLKICAVITFVIFNFLFIYMEIREPFFKLLFSSIKSLF